MRRVVYFVIAVAATACSQAGPSPTMGLDEIGTAVAKTLIAEAIASSTPTETPVPSNTPLPSNTPVPSSTPPPTITHTPRPTSTPRATSTPRPPTQAPLPECYYGCTYHPPGCNIKGNISVDTGERIYHVPGQQYYSATNISPEFGERWFCTESDAIRNGWRKAKV